MAFSWVCSATNRRCWHQALADKADSVCVNIQTELFCQPERLVLLQHNLCKCLGNQDLDAWKNIFAEKVQYGRFKTISFSPHRALAAKATVRMQSCTDTLPGTGKLAAIMVQTAQQHLVTSVHICLRRRGMTGNVNWLRQLWMMKGLFYENEWIFQTSLSWSL